MERNKYKVRRHLNGLEQLLQQGGFIKEAIEQDIKLIYSEATVKKAYQYAYLGSGLWSVMDEVERAVNEAQYYWRREDEYEEDEYEYEDGSESPAENPDFLGWYVTQSAKAAAERVQNKQEYFWRRWDISGDTESQLKRLSSLELNILFLFEGLDTGHEREAEEIAKLEQYQCETSYIQFVLNKIQRSLAYEIEEFEQFCEMHRQALIGDEKRENFF